MRDARLETLSALAFCLLIGASPVRSEPPVIGYVTQPVRHWETFFMFGEGFDGKNVRVLRGEIRDERGPEELAKALAEGETFQPPQKPPGKVGQEVPVTEFPQSGHFLRQRRAVGRGGDEAPPSP